jgi:hypothetical protein
MMLCLLQAAAAEQAASTADAAATAGTPEAPLDEGLLLHMLPYAVIGLTFVFVTYVCG